MAVAGRRGHDQRGSLIALHAHETFDELLTQLRQAHARLVQAARSAPDLERPCFKRPNGDPVTGAQRLDVLARHWAIHVEALKAAAT